MTRDSALEREGVTLAKAEFKKALALRSRDQRAG
jgi:hypothetical protein